MGIKRGREGAGGGDEVATTFPVVELQGKETGAWEARREGEWSNKFGVKGKKLFDCR